ncbi:beta-ketoacyl-[acyl-carrier-protein] synthase family protein [Aureispira sp. CCB-E]|uniref:beta-ketoacyl-[acyl-carrier-protein] synthase family protein n=1 Tax=Aureispira sp. CCB-E TaxID=3051121 RepID=UPI0028684EE1|nr:beta-ketoacyl-[acyl-carrier-protein] synthase family protein [Aureispira sp. CCB-E]WMX14608.1 beta-ketoacyl-[acyl-carrier-protein] synthase family protein [Aureispira sp. CCB-E]
MTRVLITGIGAISAIGKNAAENRSQLQKGQTGIGKATLMDTRYVDVFPFGEVPHSTEYLMEMAGIANEKGITRTDILATVALQEALTCAGMSAEEISAMDTAFVSASTVGGMSMTDELYRDGNKIGTPSEYLSSYICGAHTLKLTNRYQMKGLSTTFNTACSSSANSIMFGAKLIKSGRAKRAIVGGADGLAKFTVNGFNALRILSAKPCMPFDRDRSGLTLGEGAAFLILEAEELVGDKKVYGEVTGYGNTNDAFHPSSISDDAVGIIGSISQAIETAQLQPHQIDYINAHGTGTENNDISEMFGLSSVFGDIPPYQSTKPYTGHTLAAAGSIEAVFGLLSMEYSELYPSLNCVHPIEEYEARPITTYQRDYEIKHLLSNSFGFGGNCSSIILSKA